MESEAKLGLLAGVAAVLAVAVVYFQKPAPGPAPADPAAVAGTTAAPPGVPPAAFLVPAAKP